MKASRPRNHRSMIGAAAVIALGTSLGVDFASAADAPADAKKAATATASQGKVDAKQGKPDSKQVKQGKVDANQVKLNTPQSTNPAAK